jgi:hypothetical protein
MSDQMKIKTELVTALEDIRIAEYKRQLGAFVGRPIVIGGEEKLRLLHLAIEELEEMVLSEI